METASLRAWSHMVSHCLYASVISSLAYHLSSSYQHLITGAKSARMEETLGGILADDMGLGKTLSVLASITASLNRALDHAVSKTIQNKDFWKHIVPSKSTLIVVPSARQFSERSKP